MEFTKEKLASILDSHAAWVSSSGESGSRVILREADLSRADLRGANLFCAILSAVDLSGADLSAADLRGANLIGADLSGADLSAADLSGADLSGANLICAGQDIRGYLFYAYQDEENQVIVRAGCRKFTLAEARAHWESRHRDDPILREDCLSLIDRAERMARVRGWVGVGSGVDLGVHYCTQDQAIKALR